jgi:hypothetical protein
MEVQNTPEKKDMKIVYEGVDNAFISLNAKKQLEDNIRQNKKQLESSNYLKKGYGFSIKYIENMVIVRVAKLPIINIRNNNDDLSQYFISNKHQEEFFEKLSIYKDTDYKPYVNVGTRCNIKKTRKGNYTLTFAKTKKIIFQRGCDKNFKSLNAKNKFMNDIMFSTMKDETKYLKPDKTFVHMNSKDENTIIVNIIDVKDKKKQMLKEKLHNKIYSVSRRGIREYNNRMKKERMSADKSSFIKYKKAMNAAEGKIPIPSPIDIMKELPKYERMIKTFTSEQFRNMGSFEHVYNYFQHMKLKYGL